VADQLRASGYKPQLRRSDNPDDSKSTTPPARNLVADLAGARSDRVVMIGAHLDSVTAGPGMNDNASGSAVVLELAQQLANARLPATVRFAWWDGEEPGQLGSSRYVAALDPAERDRIMLYLNLDMVGSPNFTRLVYAGDGDHVPPGSKVVEQHLIDYFRTQGLAVDLLEPGQGSDHAAFADAGIPVGGLFTGSDPCYHQACDDLTNIDSVALDQMADAAADAVMRFAQDPAALDRAKASG
jgi:Zn-dependent M28 family amino/carboxypeptidase